MRCYFCGEERKREDLLVYDHRWMCHPNVDSCIADYDEEKRPGNTDRAQIMAWANRDRPNA